jgi:hypothetical protein
MLGYMGKTATWGDFFGNLAGSGVGLTAETLDNLKAVLLAAPVVAGAGAGMLASKATSPSKLDTDAMQREIELAELQEMQTELQRQKELAQTQQPRGVKNERTLRI